MGLQLAGALSLLVALSNVALAPLTGDWLDSQEDSLPLRRSWRTS